MTTTDTGLREQVRRLAASAAAVAGIVWLGQHGPFPWRQGAVPPPPPEASSPPATRASASSAFAIDGLPMAMETTPVGDCDAATWTPVGTPLCGDDCLLLGLERLPGEATASWLEIGHPAALTGTAAAAAAEAGVAAYHAGRLVCRRDGGGELTHIRSATAVDADALERRLVEPVTERQGPVPLLDDSVQLLRFRNLDWTVYLDEPADPTSSVDRFQAAMFARGWQARGLPARGRGSIPETEDVPEGRVLVRGNDLCLASRVRVAGRDLLLVACLGAF